MNTTCLQTEPPVQKPGWDIPEIISPYWTEKILSRRTWPCLHLSPIYRRRFPAQVRNQQCC